MQKGVVLSIFLVLPFQLFSQESLSAKKVIHLEKMVITSTKTEKTLLEVPIRTEVITSEDIEKTHAKNIKEALEYLPGLFFRESHGKQGQIISMQGFNADRILILINGERQTAPTGSSVDLTQIHTVDIDRIEIVKGASSALYGSEAMGGVINVITKSPPQGMQIKVGSVFGSYLNASTSNYKDVFQIYENFSLHKSTWNFKFASDLQKDNGFDFDKKNIDTDGDNLEAINLTSRIGLTPKANWDSSLTLNYFYDDKKREYTGNVPGLGTIKNQYLEESEKAKASWSYCYTFNNESQLKANTYYESFTDVSIEDVVASPQVDQKRSADVNLVGSDIQFDLPIQKNQIYTFGISSLFEDMNQRQEKNGFSSSTSVQEIPEGSSRSNYSFYFQPDLKIGDKWEIVPGVRYQYDSDFGSFFAPKINISFRPTELFSFRMGYGRGYRVPNLKEKYYFFDHSALGYQVIGNSELMPEQSQNLQLGADYKIENKIELSVNLFYNKIKNLIDTKIDIDQSASKGVQIFTYQNISKATTSGIETSFNFYLNKNIKSSFGYNYLSAVDNDTGRFLPHSSRHQIKIGFDYKIEKWRSELLINWIYQSKQYVDNENELISPSWNTLDIRWNKEFGESISCFIGLKNVFDLHRDPNSTNGADFRPMVGRYIYIGLEYNFNK